MSIFTESITLVSAVEDHLVPETNSVNSLFGYFKRPVWLPTKLLNLFDRIRRIIWLPPKFIGVGVGEIVKGPLIGFFLMYVLFMLGAWLINNYAIEKAVATDIVILEAIIIPMFLVTFSMPSMYGDSGVSKNTVEFVVEHLRDRGFANVKEIELLKRSVKSFEDRSRSRVNALKWLTGLLWAGFVYVISKSMEYPMTNPAELMPYFLKSVWLFIGVIIVYTCVWGYEAALDKLYRAIEFGCNDFCHIIEASSPIESQ